MEFRFYGLARRFAAARRRGYLVMYALDALTETGVWRTLKRTLESWQARNSACGCIFSVQHGGLEAGTD